MLIAWERLQPRTQSLEVAFTYPYVLATPLGFDFQFELFKRDSLYLDLERNFGIQYQFSGNSFFKAFVESKSTIVLNFDTLAILATQSLPENIDIRNNLYGVEYQLQKLNYIFNPTGGYDIKISLGAGTKKIRENNTIVELDPENLGNLYDQINLKNFQFQVGATLQKFWRLSERNTLKTSVVGKALVSKHIFENEKFRIGGNKILRGFDEESIFTPFYSIFTGEYRFLLSKNSYFYTFFDLGIVEDNRENSSSTDLPMGFGTGVTLETKAGIFGINYALGKQLDNKIEFKSAKIHFGYVNYF